MKMDFVKYIKDFIKDYKKKRQKSLRDKVIEMYGEEFAELYDKINQGIPIGGVVETVLFIDMIEKARKSLKGK